MSCLATACWAQEVLPPPGTTAPDAPAASAPTDAASAPAPETTTPSPPDAPPSEQPVPPAVPPPPPFNWTLVPDVIIGERIDGPCVYPTLDADPFIGSSMALGLSSTFNNKDGRCQYNDESVARARCPLPPAEETTTASAHPRLVCSAPSHSLRAGLRVRQRSDRVQLSASGRPHPCR